MRPYLQSNQTLRVAFGSTGVLAITARPVSGQGAPPPSPTLAADGGGADGVAILLLAIGLFAVIGIAVKLIDLSRKRTEDSMYLQARISDALLQHPALARLRIAATARVSFWRGSPAVIEITARCPRQRFEKTP